MTSRQWSRSLWDSDPLSWFTTPNLPLAAVGLTLVHSAVMLGPLSQAGSRPGMQSAAVGFAVLSMLWVHVMTRPRRSAFTVGRAFVALALASTAFVLSALGYSGEPFTLELWWAPLALSLLLFAMVPYSSAARLAMFGAVLLAVVTTVTLVFVVPDNTIWPPFAIVAITLFPIVIGGVGAVVMIRSITVALTRWSERPLAKPTGGLEDDGLVSAVNSATRVRIAPATAFIASVLERGVVTAGDVMRSSALAARLRSELTAEVGRTWIERVAEGRAIVIDDPERLADHLDVAQRTAVRALLDALLGPVMPQYGSARVELRRTSRGAIKVGLRIISTLPEGRRETFLAPYYVSLRSTVDTLRWSTGPVTAVEFEVAARSRVRSPVHFTPELETADRPVVR